MSDSVLSTSIFEILLLDKELIRRCVWNRTLKIMRDLQFQFLIYTLFILIGIQLWPNSRVSGGDFLDCQLEVC